MKRATVLLVVVLGCGSGTGLNPAFEKRWKGPATITGQGMQPFTYNAALTIDVTGDTATIFEVCPDDSGSITVKGSGDSVSWSGNYECAPIDLGGCTVRITYTSAAMQLTQDGKQLTVAGNGSLTGCGTSFAIRNAFVGQ